MGATMTRMNATVAPVAGRARLVDRLRGALLRRESPRWQMTAIVAVTGASGFLASVALLRAGLERIPLRYLAAVGIAYSVFLCLLYLWIQHRRHHRNAAEVADVFATDFPGFSFGGAGETSSPGGQFTAGGGRFGGAGASGSGNASDAGTSGSSGSGGSGAEWSFDLDDAGVVLALAAAATVLLGASIWVVVTAPTLFAELLLDGALSASLYRRLRRLPRRHWLESALRRTIVPFLLVALLLAGSGWAMERYAPEARSLGGVWNRLTN